MNSSDHPFTVCIPAAGSGSRMRSDIPKQYLNLAGKPILAHVIAIFDAIPSCSGIVIAGEPERLSALLQSFPARTGICIVQGGTSRQESVANMLAVTGPDDGIVLVHDAARPCVDAADVMSLVAAVASHGAAILATPASDTVKRVRDGAVISTLDRDEIWLAQTPQGARAGLLRHAMDEAIRRGIRATDEAALLESDGIRVHVVRGSSANLKITTPEDVPIAEAIIRERVRDGKQSG